jgi:hypothetical protein
MPNSADVQTIQSGYEDELKSMFEVLFENSLSEGLDSAAAKFSAGLVQLRAARDRAAQIVNA